jgi:N12 class adenine-specific DNA methylase
MPEPVIPPIPEGLVEVSSDTGLPPIPEGMAEVEPSTIVSKEQERWNQLQRLTGQPLTAAPQMPGWAEIQAKREADAGARIKNGEPAPYKKRERPYRLPNGMMTVTRAEDGGVWVDSSKGFKMPESRPNGLWVDPRTGEVLPDVVELPQMRSATKGEEAEARQPYQPVWDSKLKTWRRAIPEAPVVQTSKLNKIIRGDMARYDLTPEERESVLRGFAANNPAAARRALEEAKARIHGNLRQEAVREGYFVGGSKSALGGLLSAIPSTMYSVDWLLQGNAPGLSERAADLEASLAGLHSNAMVLEQMESGLKPGEKLPWWDRVGAQAGPGMMSSIPYLATGSGAASVVGRFTMGSKLLRPIGSAISKSPTLLRVANAGGPEGVEAGMKALSFFLGTGAASTSEALIEAGNSYGEKKAELLRQGYTLEQAHKIASTAGDKTFLGNILLLGVTNTTGPTGDVIRGLMKSEGRIAAREGAKEVLREEIAKSLVRRMSEKGAKITLEAAKDFVTEGLIEEQGQAVISELSKSGKPFTFENMRNEYLKQWDEGVIGGLTGIVMGGAARHLGARDTRRANRSNQNKILEVAAEKFALQAQKEVPNAVEQGQVPGSNLLQHPGGPGVIQTEGDLWQQPTPEPQGGPTPDSGGGPVLGGQVLGPSQAQEIQKIPVVAPVEQTPVVEVPPAVAASSHVPAVPSNVTIGQRVRTVYKGQTVEGQIQAFPLPGVVQIALNDGRRVRGKMTDQATEVKPVEAPPVPNKDAVVPPKNELVLGTDATPKIPASPILARMPNESINEWIQREAKHAVAHPGEMEQRYQALEDTEGGYLLGADHAAKLFGGVQQDPVIGWLHAPAVEASSIVARLEDKAIKAPMPEGKPNIIAVVGGPQGSGKTSVSRSILKNNGAGYVFDGLNLDPTEIKNVMSRIQSGGKTPTYTMVLAPLDTLVDRNAGRFTKEGRPVSPMHQAENLILARETLKTLQNEGIPAHVVINMDEGLEQVALEDGIKWLDKEIGQKSKRELAKQAMKKHIESVERLHGEKNLSEDQFDALVAAATGAEDYAVELYTDYERRLSEISRQRGIQKELPADRGRVTEQAAPVEAPKPDSQEEVATPGETQVLETWDSGSGLNVRLAKGQRKGKDFFTVTFKDMESGEVLPEGKGFATEEQARDYVKSFLEKSSDNVGEQPKANEDIAKRQQSELIRMDLERLTGTKMTQKYVDHLQDAINNFNYNDTLDPANRNSRKVFEKHTRSKLPGTISGTKALLEQMKTKASGMPRETPKAPEATAPRPEAEKPSPPQPAHKNPAIQAMEERAKPAGPAEIETVKGYHAKERRDTWVARLNQRVDDARFQALKTLAHRMGGAYSSYKGFGAIPGFQFKTEADANAFVTKALEGKEVDHDTVERSQRPSASGLGTEGPGGKASDSTKPTPVPKLGGQEAVPAPKQEEPSTQARGVGSTSGGDGNGRNTSVRPGGTGGVPGQRADIRVREDRGGRGRVETLTGSFEIDGSGVDTYLSELNLGSEAQRVKAARTHLDIIRLLKQLEEEGRPDKATPEEKAVLARWIGWGALKDAVDEGLLKSVRAYEKNQVELPDYLKSWNKNWRALTEEILAELTSEQIDAARFSTLNAHYTSMPLVKSIWGMIQAFGFKGGNVLEPSMGVGNFIGMMPRDIRGDVSVAGAELDPVTAKIAQAIYPEVDVFEGDYENAPIKDNSLDLIVTNVPFSHEIRKDGHSLHNWFFIKGLQQLRPGGMMVAITSLGTMDSVNPKHRDVIGKIADLVGAIRLPSNAFVKNAGTEVPTDLLIFRRKDSTAFPSNAFRGTVEVALGEDRYGNQQTDDMNEYFAKNPEQILGKFAINTMNNVQSGMTIRWDGTQGEFEKALQRAIDNLPQGWAQDGVPTNLMEKRKVGTLDSNERLDGSIYLDENGQSVVFYEGTRYTPAEWVSVRSQVLEGEEAPTPKALSPERAKDFNESAKVYLEMKEAAKRLREAEFQDIPTEDREALRSRTMELYKRFTRRNGVDKPINNGLVNPHIVDDPDYFEVASLEDVSETFVKEKGATKKVKTYKPVDILTRSVGRIRPAITKAADIYEAATLSIMEKFRIDPEYIGSLLGISSEDAKNKMLSEDIAFVDPTTHKLEPAWMYLSGNIREKIDTAEAAAQKDPFFQHNVDKLKEVRPKPKPISQITVKFGADWVPLRTFQDFAREIMGLDVPMSREEITGTIRISDKYVKSLDTTKSSKWNVSMANQLGEASPINILESALTWEEIKVSYSVGQGQYKENKLLTSMAREKVLELRHAFSEWLREEDNEHTVEIERIYNDRFNVLVYPKMPTMPVTSFPGQATIFNGKPFSMEKFQIEGVFSGLIQNTLLAHVVGAGKTITGGAIAMELRRLGKANRVIVSTTRSVAQQFAAQVRQLYPNSRIMVRPSTGGAKARKTFLHRLATMDYDMAILTHEDLTSIPDDPIRTEAFVRAEKAKVEEVVRGLKLDLSRGSRDLFAQALRGRLEWLNQLQAQAAPVEEGRAPKEVDEKQARKRAKQAEKSKHARGTTLDELLERKTDRVLTWDDLQADALIVDESHTFKRLDFWTQFTSLKGIDSQSSKRAMSFYLKTKAIHERNGRLICMTGTPITNTMAEIWTNLRYLRPDILESLGISEFDAFVKTFGEISSKPELDATGVFKMVTRLRRFSNIPELRSMLGQVMHRVTAKQIKRTKLPSLASGGPILRVVKPDETSQQIVSYIRSVLGAWDRAGKVKVETRHIPITAYTRSAQAALDPRLLDPYLPAPKEGKLVDLCDNIMKHYKESQGEKGTQVVFCEHFMSPAAYGPGRCFKMPEAARFNMLAEIKRMLVERGIPADEIVDRLPDNEKKRNAIFAKVNAGEVRVIMGGTMNLGVGVNIQERLIAAHHLELSTTPANQEQRNGRIERSGNLFDPIYIYNYATEGSADAFFAQMLDNKKRFADDVMDLGAEIANEADDPGDITMTYEEMMAAFTGDQRVAKKISLQNQVNMLQSEKDSFFAAQRWAIRDAADLLIRDPYKWGTIAYREKRKKVLDSVEIKAMEEAIPKILKTVQEKLTLKEKSEKGDVVELLNTGLLKLPGGYGFQITDRRGEQKGLGESWSISLDGVQVASGDARTLAGLKMSLENGVKKIPQIQGWASEQLEEGKKLLAKHQAMVEAKYHGEAKLQETQKQLEEIKKAIDEGQSSDVRKTIQFRLRRLELAGYDLEQYAGPLSKADDAKAEGDSEKELNLLKILEDMLYTDMAAEGLTNEKRFTGDTKEEFNRWFDDMLSPQWYERHGEAYQEAIAAYLDSKRDQEQEAEMAYGFTSPLSKFLYDLFGKRQNNGAVIVASDFAEVEKRYQANKGVVSESTWKRVGEGLRGVKEAFLRHFEYINPNDSAQMALVQDYLRQYEAGANYAKTVAHDMVANVVRKMSPAQQDLMNRVIITRDIIRNVDEGIDDGTGELPFGYKSVDHARQDLDKFEKILNDPANKAIADALKIRNDQSRSVVESLVMNGLLPSETLENVESYYHRQVMDYLRDRESFPGAVGSDLHAHKKGFQIGRKGGAHDFNTDYKQAEFEWLSDAMAILIKKETLDRLDQSSNIKPQLKQIAKDVNEQAMIDRGMNPDDYSASEIREILGDQFTTWKDMVPEDYTIWQPEKGSHFFPAMTVEESVLDKVMSGNKQLEKEDIRTLLALGSKKTEWVIPSNLAAQLNNFKSQDRNAVERFWVGAQSTWKQWQLISPMRVLRYNMNNLSGDLDIALAYDPRILSYFMKAASDLWSYQVTHDAPEGMQAEMQHAVKVGVVESGLTITEIPDIDKEGAFRLLTSDRPNGNAIQKVWGGLKAFTSWRENILRLAAYRFFQNELAKGKTMYAASKRNEIDALKTRDDKAAKLSRELIGDYGNVSLAGMWIRRHLRPFHSWTEINAPRYMRLFKNTAYEDGSRSARIGRTAASLGLRIGTRYALFALKINLLLALMWMWNNKRYPKETELLRRTTRVKNFLVLGRRPDGSIRYIRMDGALVDALDWFNLSDFTSQMKDLNKGQTTVKDIAANAAKAPVERILQGWEPVSKTIFEITLGRSAYPSIWKKGASLQPGGQPIRDRVAYLARNVAPLDKLWNKVTDKPARKAGTAESLMDALVIYSTDPGEASYYLTRDLAVTWLKNSKHREFEYSGNSTEKGNALYYHKRAAQWGDEEKSKHWLEEYYRLGGKPSSIRQSVKAAHPLGSVPLKWRRQFLNSLNKDDRELVDDAIAWYSKLNTASKTVRRHLADEKEEGGQE